MRNQVLRQYCEYKESLGMIDAKLPMLAYADVYTKMSELSTTEVRDELNLPSISFVGDFLFDIESVYQDKFGVVLQDPEWRSHRLRGKVKNHLYQPTRLPESMLVDVGGYTYIVDANFATIACNIIALGRSNVVSKFNDDSFGSSLASNIINTFMASQLKIHKNRVAPPSLKEIANEAAFLLLDMIREEASLTKISINKII